MRRELEVYGRAILRDILDKLNLMQKVFITAGQYDRSLNERMPEIVTDVIDQAEAATAGAAVREQICGGARSALERWSTQGLGDLAADSATKLDELVDHLVARVFDALSGSDVTDAAAVPAAEAVRELVLAPRRRYRGENWRRAISACNPGRWPTSWPTSSSGIWHARKPGNRSQRRFPRWRARRWEGPTPRRGARPWRRCSRCRRRPRPGSTAS